MVTVASKGDVEMLGMRRLQEIDTVFSISVTSVVEQLFKTVDGGTLTRLRNIGGLWGTNLSSIEPGLLGRVMSSCSRLWMGGHLPG